MSQSSTHALRHVARDESGSAIIELALSVPLLVVTIMLAMGVMLIIQARFGVQAATREAAMVGAQVNTSIDPYTRSVDAARAEAERVMSEYGLNLAQSTITFDGTPGDVARGTLFQVQIEYIVKIPTPVLHFWGRVIGGGNTYTVESVAVVPIQKHKARWPCPSPDPICS